MTTQTTRRAAVRSNRYDRIIGKLAIVSLLFILGMMAGMFLAF